MNVEGRDECQRRDEWPLRRPGRLRPDGGNLLRGPVNFEAVQVFDLKVTVTRDYEPASEAQAMSCGMAAVSTRSGWSRPAV